MNDITVVNKDKEEGSVEPNIYVKNPNLTIAEYDKIIFKYYKQSNVVICMNKNTYEQTIFDHTTNEQWGTIYNPEFREHKFLSGWIHKMVNYIDTDPIISLTKHMLIKQVVQSMDTSYKYNSMDMYECIIDSCDVLDSFGKMHPEIPIDVFRIFEQAIKTNSEVYRFYVVTNSHIMDMFIKNNE